MRTTLCVEREGDQGGGVFLRASVVNPLFLNYDFAALHHQVIRGQADGRILWQPRISCWVEDKKFAGIPLPSPFTGMDYPDIYRELKCSARIYEYNASFERVEDPAVRWHTRKLNATDTETMIETPVGRQVSIVRQVASSRISMIIKREVETEEELKVATWREEHTSWQWNQAVFDATARKWGTLGAPTVYTPRVNIQYLYLNKMGVEKGIYALYDWPDTVKAFFRAVDDCYDRLIDVINAAPIEIINFGDNLHCGTLPPDLFREYVLPAYQHRCARLHQAGKFLHAHWDGDTKTLLPYARQTRLDGIEAITPKPQGDVTLEEIKAALGDDLFLIDGIPAILFDKTYTVSMLKDYVERLIAMFAPKIILGISDEISSTGDIERVRLVGRMVDKYNRRIFPKR